MLDSRNVESSNHADLGGPLQSVRNSPVDCIAVGGDGEREQARLREWERYLEEKKMFGFFTTVAAGCAAVESNVADEGVGGDKVSGRHLSGQPYLCERRD